MSTQAKQKRKQPPKIMQRLYANINARGFPIIYSSRRVATLDREPDETTWPVEVRITRAKQGAKK